MEINGLGCDAWTTICHVKRIAVVIFSYSPLLSFQNYLEIVYSFRFIATFCVCVCVRRSIPFRLDRLSYVVHTRACFAHFKLKRYNDFCEVHILKEIQTQCGMNKRQKTDLNARLFRLWRLWWNTIDEAKRTTLNEWMAAVLSIELKMDTNSIGIGW